MPLRHLSAQQGEQGTLQEDDGRDAGGAELGQRRPLFGERHVAAAQLQQLAEELMLQQGAEVGWRSRAFPPPDRHPSAPCRRAGCR